MTEKRRFNGGSVALLLLLGVLLYLVLTGMQKTDDISYAKMRQLFEQEQVKEFAISDTRLTAKLVGDKTATCDLYDFDLFYEDLNDLVVQQKAAGIITDYDYHADHRSESTRLNSSHGAKSRMPSSA